jgi:Flp pilus assembly pilin Flp
MKKLWNKIWNWTTYCTYDQRNRVWRRQSRVLRFLHIQIKQEQGMGLLEWAVIMFLICLGWLAVSYILGPIIAAAFTKIGG